MSSFELGPIRAVGAADRRIAATNAELAVPRRGLAATALGAAPVSAELDAGMPPVDSDRVARIKKAIEEGDYPIVPQRIADAIIANGMLLRTKP